MLSVLAAVREVTGVLGEPGQEQLLPARQMQALSFVVHIPLVCFGIAFPAFVLYTEGLWLRTGDPTYRALAKRWSKVMIVLFAIGVVTGTILSFEFSLLWPNFTATFGEVFGLAFGLEGFSFFIEAIFIAVYVYGWDRLPPRVHLLCGVPIVLAGITGSLMVISVNGWMNAPTGFSITDGRVTDVDPWAALFNDNFWHEFVHMYVAALMVAGFVTAAFYARRWLSGRRDRYTRAALIVPLSAAALAAPTQIVIGDWAGRAVAETQPLKLAAFEGLEKTTSGAPFHLGGIYSDGQVRYGIAVPNLLSLLAFHNPRATVQGLEAAPPADRPPVNVTRFAFQTMVVSGTFLAALGVFFVGVWWRRRRLPRSRWFYRAVVAAGPASVVALIGGWIATELGRQPWVVYGVMRTADAVTEAQGIWTAFAALVIVYLALAIACVWLLRRLAAQPLDDDLGTAA